ncbi:MAG: serine/threonine protein kinase [Xanthomonadales bacterium]|nr:serine/threonine protein kinase [Xanthomonadales bacterium]
MNNKQQIFEQLNAIAHAEDHQKQALIDTFKANHPEEIHWLDMIVSEPKSNSTDTYIPTIPNYQVIKVIGSGANGTVYLATNQLQQQVAIKTPNVWLSDEQIARFKHEGQLLARLQHPNIAQVLDVGEFKTNQGIMPYLVLEYIEGINIDEYVQQKQLGTQQVVHLFQSVLAAVQFAHQKQVIHRDIKPDNIIVDEQGIPKLLDFGIATLDTNATFAMTQLTHTGEIVGTLAYMSPEQVSGSDDMDSRTDIYSCGVVLYQLISGRLPYEVDASQLFSAINKILNETPQNITQFNVQIDASLAAIIHHAIEKQPTNRFQTAHDFNKDLDAWLNNEPIQSQQLSKWYWLKQAAKNNRALVTGTALAFLGLLTGLVFAISFALKEQQARTLADQKAEANRQVVQFINDLFVNADPSESLGESITVKQVIESAQYSVENNLADDAAVEAQIRLVLGNAFDAIEMYPSAIAQYNQGLNRIDVSDELFFELSTQKLSSLTSNTEFESLMADINQLKNKLAESSMSPSQKQSFTNKILLEEAAYYSTNTQSDQALKILKQLKQQADLDFNMQVAVDKNLGYIHRQLGESDQAETIFRQLLSECQNRLGQTHPITLDLVQELALTLRQKNQLEEALALYETLVHDTEKNYGENSLSTLLAKINKATAHMYAGEFAKADEMTAGLLEKMIEHVGPMHQYTLTLRNIRGGALDNVGKWDEALALYQETLDLFLKSESKDNFHIISLPHNMAVILFKQKEFKKAHQIYFETRPKCEAILTLDHPMCAIMADAHAAVLIELGQLDQATQLLSYSNPKLIEKYGEDHPRVKSSNERLELLKQKTQQLN